ncbi:hypothetical protein ACNQVK_01785 [Mycobacterium sp. 134]|uniref:hypothetical protein n=1 Tax=Mycobacterium sp. 134 TaxID=3400425 RepID=UPI003AAE638D
MELDQRQGGDRTTTHAAAAPTEHGSDTKRRRRHSVVMVVAGAVILGLIGLGVNTTVADELQYRRDMGLRTNPPQRQQAQAQQLLAQLNSHDPAQVHLPNARATVGGQDRVGRNVMAAMPRTECHYTLDSVRDDGVHNDVQIGAEQIRHAYRYDLLVHEQCPKSPPVPMTIGVLSTPGTGGHWYPAALTVEQ